MLKVIIILVIIELSVYASIRYEVLDNFVESIMIKIKEFISTIRRK